MRILITILLFGICSFVNGQKFYLLNEKSECITDTNVLVTDIAGDTIGLYGFKYIDCGITIEQIFPNKMIPNGHIVFNIEGFIPVIVLLDSVEADTMLVFSQEPSVSEVIGILYEKGFSSSINNQELELDKLSRIIMHNTDFKYVVVHYYTILDDKKKYEDDYLNARKSLVNVGLIERGISPNNLIHRFIRSDSDFSTLQISQE